MKTKIFLFLITCMLVNLYAQLDGGLNKVQSHSDLKSTLNEDKLLTRKTEQMNDSIVSQLKKSIQQYQQDMPQEKVYIHFDKPFYKPSETIWGSIYIRDANNHTATQVSDAVYVNFINPKGQVEQSLTLEVKNGKSALSIALPQDIVGGLYTVQAYTTWQKNFGKEAFFSKELIIQKLISPKLLLKLDFDQKGYAANDTVSAKFEALDLQNNKITFQNFSYSVSLKGNVIMTNTMATDKDGKALIRFPLPSDLNTSDGLLNVIVEQDGKSESIARSIPIVLNSIDFQCMPEGGDLVANVLCKVAFKALNEFGKATDVEGILVDEAGNEITQLKSFHRGMGAFVFTPQKGKSYHVQLTRPEKIEKKYALPAVLENGYALGVDTIINDLVKVHFYAPITEEVYLIALQQGKVFFGQSILPSQGLNLIDIPVATLSAGIVQITLFDKNKLPLAERLVFVHRDKNIKISLTTDKAEYQPHEKVTLSIETKDEQERPVEMQLSLSVANDQHYNIADDKQDNILSYLLMSSDLKGKIEEPHFYFKDDEPKATLALDYVMMTHGWRRYNWQTIFQKTNYITYYPEKRNMISGTLFDANSGDPLTGKLLMVELLGNKGRFLEYNTNTNGRFVFSNLPLDKDLQLLVKIRQTDKIPYSIRLDGDDVPGYNESELNLTGKEDRLEVTNKAINPNNMLRSRIQENFENITLNNSVMGLESVVVNALGIERDRSSASQSHLSLNGYVNLSLENNMINTLQGRIAGINITRASLGSGANINIRGLNTFSSADPLYILDGIPIIGEFSPELINTLDIKHITVLKGSEATALYGSRASNGVIVISTITKYDDNDYERGSSDKKPEYKSLLFLGKKSFSEVASFYEPKFTDQDTTDHERDDFRSTIYWNPGIQTDAEGKASVSFYTSEELTSFRIVAEGISKAGEIGRKEMTISNNLPLNIDTDIPPFLTVEDSLMIPVYIKNNTIEVIKGKLIIHSPLGILLLQESEIAVDIAPRGNQTYYISCVVVQPGKKELLRIEYVSDSWQNTLQQSIDIEPKGFPTEISFSGNKMTQDYKFNIPRYVNGSLNAEFTAYPLLLNQFMSSIESMFRQPHGCFEQVTSSTFPNVLALQFLKITGLKNPEVEKKAMEYIKDGYERLIKYEVDGGGFDWFGHKPAHEGLTAFGILEFMEMQKVYDGVSQPMISRTIDWLWNRRNKKGGFDNSTVNYHSITQNVANAYIVYTLAQTLKKGEIYQEYSTALEEAQNSKDPYRMALLAHASLSMGFEEKGLLLLNDLKKIVNEKGFDALRGDESMVGSYGSTLSLEIASLMGLTQLKTREKDESFLLNLTNWLMNKSKKGMYGSTQSTVMVLQYLNQFLSGSLLTQKDKNGTLQLELNEATLFTHSFNEFSSSLIKETNWENQMSEGEQSIKVQFTEKVIPFSVRVQWNSYTPNSSKECKVNLETQLSNAVTKVNETVRLTTTIANTTNEQLPMTVALVGIPSGLSLQPWQLKEIQEKQVVDFYEVKDNYIIFYYRGLLPNEVKTIHLDLKAEIPGVYQAPAASAYLYYNDEYKVWEGGEKIKITL